MREKKGLRGSNHDPARAVLIGALALAASLILVACQNGTVVNDPGATASPTAPSSPGAGSSPIPGATAQPAPSPAGRAELLPSPAGEQRRKPTISDAPIQYSPAKAATPTPEPFPAQPTPTLVIKEGKIVQQWPAPPEAAKLVNPVKDQPNAAEIGRDLYMQKCVDCHGREGKGNGWMSRTVKTPTNLASQMVQANTDGELFWKVTNGRSPMPAHRARFDDEQRWYIVTFLRTLK